MLDRGEHNHRKNSSRSGTPNRYALEMMKKVAGSRIVVSINPQRIGGFTRPSFDDGE